MYGINTRHKKHSKQLISIKGTLHMKLQKIISIALITSMLAGCNPPPPGAGQDTGGVSKQDIGTVLGGIGGAVIGSTMGRGNGRIATTAAGAILGGLAGSAIGKSLDRSDANSNNNGGGGGGN